MPEYETPREAATAAYDALRYLAHTVRETPPRELYDLNRELLGISRLLPDVFRRFASRAIARNDEAIIRTGGTIVSGVAVIEEAARDVLQAAEFVDRAETRLGRTSEHLSLLEWPTPHRPDAPPAASVTTYLRPEALDSGTLAPKTAHGPGRTAAPQRLDAGLSR